MTITTVLLLLVGLVALVGGAEALVRGAARLAARTGMSSLVIGLTVVAFGTSAPELAVSVGDALSGSDEAGAIAVGNVVGSNIANVLLVLGLTSAITGGLFVAQRIVRLDVPIMIGVSALVLLFALDERIGRLEGFVLLASLVVYVSWTVITARRETDQGGSFEYGEVLDPARLSHTSAMADIALLVVGLILLLAGSQALVAAATDIAEHLGVSELVIGLTVVAIGTSLPELATSVLAAVRGQRDLAVGNAIGSNLFNLMAVLGLTAVVAPNGLPIAASSVQVDIPVMLAVAVACLPMFANGYVLQRWEGIVFLLGYLGYLTWIALDATDSATEKPYGTVMLFFVVPVVASTIAIIWYRGRHGAPIPSS